MYNVSLFQKIAAAIADGRVWAATCVRNRQEVWKIVFTSDEILHCEPDGLDVDYECGLSAGSFDSLIDLWRSQYNAQAFRDGDDTILLESFGQRKQLVICGAGHVALNVIRIAKIVGFHVTSIEDRPVFSNMAAEAGADRVICDSFDSGLEQVVSNEDTCFIVMTRGHRFDEICLRSIFQKDYAYIGMMGSRGRTVNVKRDMRREGISDEKLDALHAPIGLDLGAQTPAEIAVSVVGELIQFLRGNNRAIDDGIESVVKAAVEPENAEAGMVMATIMAKRGETPRTVGTKMLVLGNGQLVGTIGGGCAEAEVITQARAMIAQAREIGAEQVKSRIVDVDLTPAQGNDEDSMHCGGIQEILLEMIDPS